MNRSLAGGLAVAIGALVSSVTPSASAACTAAYYGGPVVTNVEVVVVYWTSGVNAAVKAYLPSFFGAVTNSAYMDWLYEYDTAGLDGGSNQFIGRGTYKTSVTITPSVMATSLSDAQIQTELAAQIQSAALPAPSLDGAGNVNTVYAIAFPPAYTISYGGARSCVDFCEYHASTMIAGKTVPYLILPDLSQTGCATGCVTSLSTLNDRLGSIASHSLIEAVTDPAITTSMTTIGPPMAWYAPGNGCGEIGDICNAQSATLLTDAGTFTVQKQWSNVAASCIATATRSAPICTSPNTPAGCRGCTKSDDGVACSGATPRCDTAPTSATYGRCVAAPTIDAGSEGGATDAGGGDAGTSDGGGNGDAGGIVDASAHDDGGNGASGGTSSGCSCVVGADDAGVPGLLGGAVVAFAIARRRRRA